MPDTARQEMRPIYAEQDYPAGSGVVPFWKRALDLWFIFLTLPAWGPVMLFMAGFIKLMSPGPVFFKQERVGHLGRRFVLYKFRTMKVNAETAVHQDHLNHLIQSDLPMTKIDSAGDNRLIPFGWLLRSSGLDELAQLINVIRGDMSIVGPRPCLTYEFEKYRPWQKERFNALPGLTGLWQVSGKNKTTFNEMINLDIIYSRNCSIKQDLKIMGKTFAVLFRQVSESRRKGVRSEE